MINYSIDTNIRRHVVLFLALGSAGCGYFLGKYFPVEIAPAKTLTINVGRMSVVMMARVYLNVIRPEGLAHILTRKYRQGVNGKLQMITDVFLIRLVRPACGFRNTNIQPALRALPVHRDVERGIATAHSGKQRLVGMHYLLAVGVTMMGPKLSGPSLEAATITFVTTNHIVGRHYLFNRK